MSVKPPMGTGRVRLIEIAGYDLQPCGGTHVRSTAEIGAVRVNVRTRLLEQVVQSVGDAADVTANLQHVAAAHQRERVTDVDSAFVGIGPAFEKIRFAEGERTGALDGHHRRPASGRNGLAG